MNIKSYYKREVKKVISKLNKEDSDIKFAVVTDSHLDNSLHETLENIRAVESKIDFDFMLHLGDFLNGNIPKEYTEKIFKEQIELFENTIKGKFFPLKVITTVIQTLKTPILQLTVFGNMQQAKNSIILKIIRISELFHSAHLHMNILLRATSKSFIRFWTIRLTGLKTQHLTQTRQLFSYHMHFLLILSQTQK